MIEPVMDADVSSPSQKLTAAYEEVAARPRRKRNAQLVVQSAGRGIPLSRSLYQERGSVSESYRYTAPSRYLHAYRRIPLSRSQNQDLCSVSESYQYAGGAPCCLQVSVVLVGAFDEIRSLTSFLRYLQLFAFIRKTKDKVSINRIKKAN